MSRRTPGRGNSLKRLQIGMSFAFFLAAAFALGYLAGAWVDERLGTFPWFSTAGIVLGLVAAFRTLLRDLSRIESDSGSSNGGRQESDD